MSTPDDMASDLEEVYRDNAIKNRVQYKGVSPVLCVQCGNEIEPKRREVIPGTVLCASCANDMEKRRK